jgi:molecular chaperone GrpE (heat shock protein)
MAGSTFKYRNKRGIIVSVKEMVMEAIDSIEQVADLFYQQKDKDGYEILEGTLNLLVLLFDKLVNNKDVLVNISEEQFNANLAEAMRALEKKDTILLADILKYEIGEMLNDIVKSQ